MKMKYILFFTAILGVTSCAEPNVNSEKTNYILTNGGRRVQIIEMDSCEYVFYNSAERAALAHKGNCKYCAIRAKKQRIDE